MTANLESNVSPLRIIPLPPQGLRGIQALIELGPDRLRALAEQQLHQPLFLSLGELHARLAASLECDRSTIQSAITQALIPLNGLRRSLDWPPAHFLDALNSTISEQTTAEWRDQYLNSWKSIVQVLPQFFEPDNFFAQASKAFDLLVERPAILQGVRILTELRPIYDEATTKTLAFVQTNTLVLDFLEGNKTSSVHVTLDSEDLDTMERELRRARDKIDIVKREAQERGDNVVTFGDHSG